MSRQAFQRGLSAIVLAVCACPGTLWAHAILLRSSPAAHATVEQGTVAIELHFNSRVDGARSRLTLTTAKDATASHSLPLGKMVQTAPETLTCGADTLPSGDYTLHWIVLASDGHISRGEISFVVR